MTDENSTKVPADFKTVFEATPCNSALLLPNAPTFTILAVTDGFLLLNGTRRATLVGKGIFESFPSNPGEIRDTGAERLRNSLIQVIDNKTEHEMSLQRYDVQDADGIFSERYWKAVNKPILDADGSVLYIIHTAEEVTELIKAQELELRIKEIEQEHRLLMDAPFAVSILKGPRFIIEMVNEPMIQIWGKGKDILHKPILDVIPEIKDQGYIKLMTEVLMSGIAYKAYEQDTTFYKNGEWKKGYFNFFYQPYYEKAGDPATGILIYANEVTEKVDSKLALAAGETRFTQIANTLPIVVWTASPDGNLTYISEQWEKFYGNPVAESLGTGWVSFLHTDDVPDAGARWALSLSSGNDYETEFRVRHKDGSYHWVLVRAVPIKNNNGEIIAWYGSNTDIEDKKITEEALRASSEKFRQLLEATPQMTWTNLPVGDVTFYNEKWFTYTGLNFEKTKDWGWQEVIHPDDLQLTVKAYTDALRRGDVFVTENRYKRADGEYRWHLNRALPLKDKQGEIYLWIGTATDIHDLKQTERALQESEQQVRTLVESAPFPIGVFTGKEMRISLANQAILDTWGKGDDVVGKLFAEIMPELDNQQIFQQLDKVFTTGIPFYAKNAKVEIETRGELQPYYFNYSFKPLFDINGNVYGVMNTAADVTDLTLAIQKVEEKEKSFRNTILKAPVAMCVFKGPNHIVEIANKLMIELFGKTAKEILNKPIFEGLPEARDQGFEQLLDGVFTTGETYAAEGVPVTLPREGKITNVYVNFVYAANKESNGITSGILAVAVDVTAEVIARKKIEEVIAERTGELAKANANLQRSNAELAQFAYIASHDLQEPLRKITVFSQMLGQHLTGTGIDAQTQNFLTKIDSSATRMINLVRDVLVYSELAKENSVFQPVKLLETIEGIKTDFELLIEQKNALLVYRDLPVIEAIPLQMSQLFGNLVSNALKFSRRDIRPIIEISAENLSPAEILKLGLEATGKVYYNIEVRDNGIGFNKEYADQIFNIFQRLHGKSDYSGTGIGLAMCKKIVQNHGGEIYATATEDKGAVFNVILPKKQIT